MTTEPGLGTTVAGYRIQSLLGRGGMSAVYVAEDLRLKRQVALKVLAPALAEGEGFRDRFVRESQIAAGMEHPNIVPIYEAGESDGQLFIAMRWIRGTDLHRLLEREGTLDPNRAIRICSEVAAALDAAHLAGLVHRDVNVRRITDQMPSASDVAMTWTPDGCRILFWGDAQHMLGLYSMTPRGTDVRLLTPPGTGASTPDVSPDGRWVILGGEWDNPAPLSLLDLKGGQLYRLTQADVGEPRWRPTGS